MVIGSPAETQALAEAVKALREGLDGLGLDETQHSVVEEDVTNPDAAVQEGQVDAARVGGLLQSLQAKLTRVGVVLVEVVALAEPVEKIARLLGTMAEKVLVASTPLC